MPRMTRPKQIIYPLRYAGALSPGNRDSEAAFVKSFTDFLGGNIAVVPIGRARGGIYLLAKLAVHEGRRRVILSPYTIPDVVNMVRFAGGEPVFVDVLPNSTNIDLEHLAELVDDETACVIVTHYHVTQNQLAAIRAYCRDQGVALYDDCAIVIGSSFEGARIGGSTDASVFSLSSFKALNFFWGGALTTRRPELAKALAETVATWPRLTSSQYRAQIVKTLKYDVATKRRLFAHFVFPLLRQKVNATEVRDILPLSRVESTALEETVTSRPSFSATAEWQRKLDTVDLFLQHRRRIAAIYDRYFADIMVSRETASDVRSESGYVNYPIAVAPERRNAVYKDILAADFDVGLSLYPNAHETVGFTQIPGRSRNVSALVRSSITLPTHPRIAEGYAEQLAKAVRDVLTRHGCP